MRLIDAEAFERRCMFDAEINDMQDVMYALRDFPTVESRQKGKWVETINSIGGNLIHNAYECSWCNLDLPYKTKFCPNCGAYMGGEEE